MSTETITRTLTKDTGETINAPGLPADDRTGDGYDWMETLTGTVWSALPNWGSEGWDAGAWPYIIFAVARHRDGAGELFGHGTYVEGDTRTCWFRSQAECFEAVTEEVFFHWNMGQSHGPEDLARTEPAQAITGPGTRPLAPGNGPPLPLRTVLPEAPTVATDRDLSIFSCCPSDYPCPPHRVNS